MANKNLILFSTHVINKAVISEYKKFLNIPNYDCVLVINNEVLKLEPEYSLLKENFQKEKYVVTKNFYGINIPCLLFDSKLSQNLNLPNNYKNIKEAPYSYTIWYNGDYRLYYTKKFFPDYDFYWQIEYDVFMNGRSYWDFFKKYDDKKEDLLITKFRPETPHSGWGWNDNLEWLYGTNTQIYGSFFPVLRLSKTAVEFLYKRRLEISEIFKSLEMNETTQWVFCEAFLPTELMLNGFSCGNIEEENCLYYEAWDLNSDRIFENPDNKLYHPVKGDFINRIKRLNKIIEALKNKLPSNNNNI